MRKTKFHIAAFTLIELVIVLGIVAILAVISFGTLLNSQAQQQFNNKFDEILSVIKEARSLAISAKGQLDYTDADQDGCKDSGLAPEGANCWVPDYATPANYGVNFASGNGESIVKLFSDLYPPLANAQGVKGSFEEGTMPVDYQSGKDLVNRTVSISDTYTLQVYRLVDENNPPNFSSISLFFSPLYADLKFQNITFNNEMPVLVIKLKENSDIQRCRQIKIHQMTGIPEVSNCS